MNFNFDNKKINFWDSLKTHPKKIIMTLGIAGLIVTSSIKDNVHLGSVELHNPQGNHYTIGIIPNTSIVGQATGNINTYSLIGGINELKGENSKITGNLNSYGLLAGLNHLMKNTSIKGNMNSFGLYAGSNELNKQSEIIGNMNSYGLCIVVNNLNENTKMEGNLNSYGIYSLNELKRKSKFTGDITNKGIIVGNSVKGFSVGSKDVKGLENYVIDK